MTTARISPHPAGTRDRLLARLTHREVLVCGIVNVTPDSFYPGARHRDPIDAVDHALRLVDEGADLLDIGGESTRPGATPPSVDAELERVVGVIEAVTRATSVPVRPARRSPRERARAIPPDRVIP